MSLYTSANGADEQKTPQPLSASMVQALNGIVPPPKDAVETIRENSAVLAALYAKPATKLS